MEALERALLAPRVRETPKHAQLLSQLEYEMAQSLQLAMSRPAEWFEILGRGLRLDEQAVAEREERLKAAIYHHAAELSAHSARAAEEVQAEEDLMHRSEKQLTAEAEGAAERIAAERRALLADRGARPDIQSAMRAAIDATKAEGEARLLERRREANERIDAPTRSGGGGGGGGGSASDRPAGRRRRAGRGGRGAVAVGARAHVRRAAAAASTRAAGRARSAAAAAPWSAPRRSRRRRRSPRSSARTIGA